MDIGKRLKDIEKKVVEQNRVPIIIAEPQSDGRCLFNGRTYTEKELGELQKKNDCPVILDDVCAIVWDGLKNPRSLEAMTKYIGNGE